MEIQTMWSGTEFSQLPSLSHRTCGSLPAMAMLQLNPTLPLIVHGKGPGMAVAVIDYGENANLIWIVIIDATGEIWCAPNPKVRAQSNWTFGRPSPNLSEDG